MEYTKKSLDEAVTNFKKNKKPIPFYDSTDEKTRKQIGEVVDMEVVDDHIEMITKVDDSYAKHSQPKLKDEKN